MEKVLEEGEVLKEIPDFPNYMVSNKGRVWSNKKNDWLIPSLNKYNYHQRYVVNLGRKNRFYIHQLVAKAFIPNPDNLPEIDHIDGNSLNNNVENLRWVTHEENMNNPITKERIKRNGGSYVVIEEIATGQRYKGYEEASILTGLCKATILKHCKGRVKNPQFRLTGERIGYNG